MKAGIETKEENTTCILGSKFRN